MKDNKSKIAPMSDNPLDRVVMLCPFCGVAPVIGPHDPDREGNAFGYVACINARCPANPVVRDGEDISDERGSDAYKAIAIARWNKRA